MVAGATSILDRKLLRDMRTFGGQAVAIVLVLACAAASATLSFSAKHSLEDTRSRYYRLYHFADLFASVPKAPLSLVETIRQIAGIAAVEPRIVGYAAISVNDFDEPMTGRLISLPASSQPNVNALALRQGHIAIADHPDEVMVNEGFALAHGIGPGARFNATINGRKRVLTIAGVVLSPEYVYALGPGQIVPDDRRYAIIWMGREAVAADFGLADSFNDLAVRLRPDASTVDVIAELNRILNPYGGTEIHGRSQQYSHAFVSGQLRQLAAIGFIVPSIFLGVAIFLLHAFIFRVVELQRAQIGIVKALGIDGSAVGRHYVKLALILASAAAVVGIAVGVVLGYGVTEIYARFFHFPFLDYRPDPVAALGVVAVLGCAGVLGALRSAQRAVRLPPAVALLPATPTAHRRIPGESLVSRLGTPSLMIFRHLARRPLGSILTTVCIAFAVGLQIATLFSFDALDHMVDVYYGRTQRQDVTVNFPVPLLPMALSELAGLPGVVGVEGFRSVPVRLSFAGKSSQVALVGLPATGSLYRILDLALMPVPAPADGIALSRTLAEILGTTVGDRVAVTVSDSGLSFQLPVAGLVEQYIGTGAYMELSALDEVLGDDAVVSGANVKFAEGEPGPFYRALKDSPFVAGLVPRAATIAAFRQTMARTLTIIVSFFVAFACVAGVATVDAMSRIALSERAHDLAILRALGFGTCAVAFIFAGELAVSVALALPLGCAAGLGLGQLIVWNLDSELFRVPLIVGWDSYVIANGTVLAAAAVSLGLAALRLRRLDISATLRAGAS